MELEKKLLHRGMNLLEGVILDKYIYGSNEDE